jgi:hypothetical protein
MIRIQLDQVPLLVLFAILMLIPLKWISLHLALRATLKLTPLADRWRVYREFARGHNIGTSAIVLVFKIFRPRQERTPLTWVYRGGPSPR